MTATNSDSEDQFFPTRDDISSVSDLSSDCSEDCLDSRLKNCALGYDFWTKEPDSVDERRRRFLGWMDLNSDRHDEDEDEEEDDSYREDMKNDIDESRDKDEATYSQSYEATYSIENKKIMNLENGRESVMDDELGDEGSSPTSLEVDSNKTISIDEFQKTLGSSSLVQQLLQKDCRSIHMVDPKKKSNNWLQRFSGMTHIVDKTKALLSNNTEANTKTGSTRRVRVNVCKKHSKELASLYTGQEFPAHEGSILTMKFSHDGGYLGSAGVDGVVRVWKVLEDEIANKFNAQEMDPSCLYFSTNYLSKLVPLDIPKEKDDDHMKGMNKSSDLACVVLPPKVFQLSEKPIHEFHGHKGEVLALSWSKNGLLLSSSVDKTARLWKVGHDDCLGVYSHNNYVTCIEFNPVDDNHFISGSIDGKLRIWEVEGGRVVDWTDIREIVTAVCYRPDGMGGVVGTMDGNCRFYDIIDNRLQLGASICLKGKKKLPGKRITGFQYCPIDVTKVMVTSADSQVQILSGTNIICKFKGSRSSGSHVPAAFTSDGEHIISATDDSNVRVWNYTAQDHKPSSPKLKKVWSCESFLSCNASIAVPWCGLKNKLGAFPGSILGNGHLDEKLLQKLPASFPDCLATSLGFFLDALYKGSATWPEEKLPKLNPAFKAAFGKADFKFLKNSWLSGINAPHLWGLVIVTAGWDGCIRTFLNYGLPIRF